MALFSVNQWRIQDFPGGSANLLFSKLFAQNRMNMQQFGPRGVCTSLVPLGSATVNRKVRTAATEVHVRLLCKSIQLS